MIPQAQTLRVHIQVPETKSSCDSQFQHPMCTQTLVFQFSLVPNKLGSTCCLHYSR